VAFLHLKGGALAVVQQLPIAEAQDLPLLGFLLRGVRQHNAAGRPLLGLQTLDYELVVQWDYLHGFDSLVLSVPGSSGLYGRPYARTMARITVYRTTCLLTGFGITLYTWARSAWRIKVSVASAVTRMHGSVTFTCWCTSWTVSSPVSLGMCMSISTTWT